MKGNIVMNKREKKIMEYLWNSEQALTIKQIEEFFKDEDITRTTIFKAVQSLFNKGYVRVGGLEKSVKSYARQVEPAITREEYAALLLNDEGIRIESIGDVIAAMIGNSKKTDLKKERQIIEELEKIISDIKGRQE